MPRQRPYTAVKRVFKAFSCAADAYRAGYSSRTAAHIRRGFAKAGSSHVLALGFAQGANAFFVAERFGIDLTLPASAIVKAAAR